MSMKKMESVIKYLPTGKILISHGFIGEFYQVFKKKCYKFNKNTFSK